MKFLLSATFAAALALLAGCSSAPSGSASSNSSPSDGPGTRAGNSGVEVFGTIDANVSGTRNK